MANPGFVHLHTHTEFSLLDGASRIPDLVKRAVDMEMPALAITDHGAMYGNITFYSEAKSKGIKPILGCEVYVAPRTRFDKDARLDKEQHHLVLLAQNENGYKNLIKLVSIAFQEGFYYKPRVDKELLSQYSKDLIAMTACLGGEIPYHILANNMAQAEKSLGEYMEIFGRDNLYLELQENGIPEQTVANEALIQMARTTGLKLVATNDIHYTDKADSGPHDVLLCIQTNSTIDDPKRMRFSSQEFYMKSQEEMHRLFGHIPGALENTLEIAERCNIKFDFGQSRLPDPGVPTGVSPNDHMIREAQAGLLARMGGSISEDYQKQFDYECGVINQCGFATYMLIVRDFTDFARQQGIYVGVRGSAAGSLVCYGLGITDVDPIEYGLTFERFLNPERIEMPDVDLDIQDDRRDDLIRYVIDKYGQDHVSMIATFGSLKARAAVRDCGRVLGMDLSEVDRICKMIPTIPVGVTIDQALEENPEFKAAYNGNAEAKRLVDTARSLEGLNRNVGVHAAGVLICADPLTDHVPVHFGGKGEVVAQLAKKDIQKVGLLKMDFLGLANLTILGNAVANVKKSQGIDIDIMKIPLDDAKTFEMLGRGETNGVFQLESAGMRRNVMDLKPNSVRELAAIVALYRPGPMAFIPNFVKSKFGQMPITYLHPDMEPILRETYGVICYQEQVLGIARAIAGFTLGQADVLRKAMSSKNREIMDQQRVRFTDGAKNKGVDPEIAAQIYDQIEPFAGYAFNKAHAVCYAFVAYRTAYMKANYPVEYYSALLSANMDDKDALAMYMGDCKLLGVKVLPPDVNHSGIEFEVEDGAIRFGLAAVKGVGRGVVEAIMEARKEGPFKSLHEFCRRVNTTNVPQSAVDSLIKIGAFDSINTNRAQLLFILEDAVTAAARDQRDRRVGQELLFGAMVAEDGPSYLEPQTLPQVAEATRDDMLAWEKDLLGLYVSDHPLQQYKDKLEKLVTVTSDQLREKAEKEEVIVGGRIARIKKMTTKKNDMMAIVTIEDFKGTMEVTIFPRAYDECIQHLIEDRIVVIRGKANHRERMRNDEASTEINVICETVMPIANGTNGNGNGNGNGGLRAVNIRVGEMDRERLMHLRSILGTSSGESPVFFHVPTNGRTRKVCVEHRVDPTPRFLSELERLLGKEVVWVE